jgi:hypothetical protein
MRTVKRYVAVGALLLTCLLPLAAAQRSYNPPELLSASDASVQYQVLLDGFFVLKVSLDEDGKVENIDSLRDPGAMLGAAKISVGQWKFRPASYTGKPTASDLTVCFVYEPINNGSLAPTPPTNFAPVLPAERPEAAASQSYKPVGILSFTYPHYPNNSVAWGSVVVQVTVGSNGALKSVDFLHGTSGFNNLVSDALQGWRFQAASLDGKPVTSKVVIAFTFLPPISN